MRESTFQKEKLVENQSLINSPEEIVFRKHQNCVHCYVYVCLQTETTISFTEMESLKNTVYLEVAWHNGYRYLY